MSTATFFRLISALLLAATSAWSDPIDIGSRRELFVDDLLVDSLRGSARRAQHAPQLMPAVAGSQPAEPWGNVFRDGDTFKMIVRGLKQPGIDPKQHGQEAHYRNHILQYFESPDGIHWRAPALGLHTLPRFPAGNVIMADNFGIEQTFAAFLDTRPDVPAAQRFKGLGGKQYPQTVRAELTAKYGAHGLRAYASPDAIHWTKLHDEPVIPGEWGHLDSQNIVFWSEHESRYVCYFRSFENPRAKGLRSVKRTTSSDFRHWTAPVDVEINHPGEQLYTSNIEPYARAPHLYIGLPTRFMARRGAATDILFVTSRDGLRFTRPENEAFIRPGLDKSAWGNRANYAAYHIMQTTPKELSIYVSGGRRYTLRTDGFASIHAGQPGGELLTKPIIFAGRKLTVNFSTSAAGSLAVELQDAGGAPLPGFSLADCQPAHGDEIARPITWKGGSDLSAFAGRPVRLRFVLTEADLFALKFD